MTKVVLYQHIGTEQQRLKRIKDLTKATIRCIPLDSVEEAGSCILTGNSSGRRVLFAKAY
jgi:prolyl-tRNA synthetase